MPFADPKTQREYLTKYQRGWRRRNPTKMKEWARKSHLKRMFGMSVEEYETRLGLQGGRCYICGTLPGTKSLPVDHNHQTGAIRGILCMSCNNGLGRFKDDPGLLRQAANYLEVYS